MGAISSGTSGELPSARLATAPVANRPINAPKDARKRSPRLTGAKLGTKRLMKGRTLDICGGVAGLFVRANAATCVIRSAKEISFQRFRTARVRDHFLMPDHAFCRRGVARKILVPAQ
jgi:hypothetical protein